MTLDDALKVKVGDKIAGGFGYLVGVPNCMQPDLHVKAVAETPDGVMINGVLKLKTVRLGAVGVKVTVDKVLVDLFSDT